MAAWTSHRALAGGRGWKLQKFGQGCCSGLMHGRAHRHFDGFQIETAGLAAVIENDTQQLI
jgi:hypothetical protein